MEYSRPPPSSWALEVLKVFHHCGQGLSGLSGLGGTRDDLELVDAGAALAVDGAEAVGPGVAAADDDDVLVLRIEERVVGDGVAGVPPVLQREEVHREVDALEVAPLDGQVAGLGGAAAEADGVVLVEDLLRIDDPRRCSRRGGR